MNRFGEQIYEDILHFDVRKGATNLIEPRSVARDVLEKAKKRAPGESLGDLEDALRRAEEVQASAIYDLEDASSRSSGQRAKEAKT